LPAAEDAELLPILPHDRRRRFQLNTSGDWRIGNNTEKAPTYAAALDELKAEGKCPKDTQHRQVKYLNNIIEADHGKLKQLIRPVRGFKSMKTAYATIKGFEVMRALRKGQAAIFNLTRDIRGEARFSAAMSSGRASGVVTGPIISQRQTTASAQL
jgi:hypothetical protein